METGATMTVSLGISSRCSVQGHGGGVGGECLGQEF